MAKPLGSVPYEGRPAAKRAGLQLAPTCHSPWAWFFNESGLRVPLAAHPATLSAEVADSACRALATERSSHDLVTTLC